MLRMTMMCGNSIRIRQNITVNGLDIAFVQSMKERG